MNIVRYFLHWFCRDVAWRYPELAALDSNYDHVYPMTCTNCGYVKRVRCEEIQRALYRTGLCGLDQIKETEAQHERD